MVKKVNKQEVPTKRRQGKKSGSTQLIELFNKTKCLHVVDLNKIKSLKPSSKRRYLQGLININAINHKHVRLLADDDTFKGNATDLLRTSKHSVLSNKKLKKVQNKKVSIQEQKLIKAIKNMSDISEKEANALIKRLNEVF
jgi:hypothetical protein